MGDEKDNEKKMTMEEKLDYLDREIRLLHKFCLNAGYSSSQIEVAAKPFFSSVKTVKWERTRGRLLKVAVFVAIIAGLVHYDPAYRILAATGRHASLQILPLWDFTQLYEWDCLVDNPLFPEEEVKEEDCKICEEVKEVERLTEMSVEGFLENLENNPVPIIVVNAMEDWPETTHLTIKQLKEIYEEHSVLSKYLGCKLKTSISGVNENPRRYFKTVEDNAIESHFAHWENCIAPAAKAFREFYKRPSFIGNYVQLSMSNWVMVSNQYTDTEPIEFPVLDQLLIVMQITGQTTILIEPTEICEKLCHSLNTTLQQGEIMTIPSADMLYNVHYIPDSSGESITVVVSGNYDE